MALADAVLAIADEMEGDISLSRWSLALRMAVKAAEGSQPAFNLALLGQNAMSPAAQHALGIEKAREEFREKKARGDAEETAMGRVAVAVGGESDGDTTQIAEDMPTGGKMELAGQVYVLSSEGKLVYSEGETNKLRRQREAIKKEKA